VNEQYEPSAGAGPGAIAVPVEEESNEVQALREQLRRHERPVNLGLRPLVFVGSPGDPQGHRGAKDRSDDGRAP
jgi:hypothetical protein